MGRFEQKEFYARQIGKSGKRQPLEVRLALTQHPELKTTVRELLDAGVGLSFQRRRSVPHELRESAARVAAQHNGLYTIWARPFIAEGNESDHGNEDLARIQAEVPNFMRIQATGQTTVEQDEQIASLNAALAPQQRRYAYERLLRDRTADEADGVLKLAGVTVGAAAGAVGFEHIVPGLVASPLVKAALEGFGTFVAGQSDDFLGALTVGKTEDGGEKSLGQIIRENKKVFAAIGIAGTIDLFVPTLFRMATQETRPLVSALYWATATGGSMVVSAESYRRSRKALERLYSEGALPNGISLSDDPKIRRREIRKLAREEFFGHRYRRGLSAGLATSLALSLGFGETGQLMDQPWSGGIQAGIGPEETVVAMLGMSKIDEKLYEMNRRIRLREQVRRLPRPVQESVVTPV